MAAGAAAPAAAAIIPVTTTADDGPGSLRAAIHAANAAADPDTITFALGADKTIVPASALPGIFHPVDIDGTSQPGWSGTPIVELAGTNASTASGLTIYAGPATIRGLVINRFELRGLEIAGGSGHVVKGNYIGTDVAGTSALGNQQGGITIYTTTASTIGGITAADRNVISGNPNGGINVSNASNIAVIGNYIGTTAAGNTALGNASYGVAAYETTDHVYVGVALAGAGNVISGNARGVAIAGVDSAVLGNVIGLNAAGTAAIPNAGVGVDVWGANALIGGTVAVARNVVAGNAQQGIAIHEGATGVSVRGNRIGTNAAGTAAIANGSGTGIRVFGSGNAIGGAESGAGNLIAAASWGVTIEPAASDNAILGNVIGLDVTGMVQLGNGTGVHVRGSGNVVGEPGAGNVISGNTSAGVTISGATAIGNRVQANLIGTALDGTTARGNGDVGVWVRQAFDNLIGGTAPGEGNVIAFNGLYGVFVDAGTGNAVLGNRIFDNGYWGIDLAPYGVTPNDAGDGDLGPNRTQNHPVLTLATVGGGTTAIEGVLDSTPATSFRIELFASPACDPSGAGEGHTFLGATDVVTDASGHAAIATMLPFEVGGPVLTATATSAGDDTSEFSPCVKVNGPHPGVLQFSQDQFVGYENEIDGVVQVTVTRAEGSDGTVTVDYATSDAGATAGVDYTTTSGTLTFGPGEVVKTVDVPVAFDLDVEGQENITLALGMPGGGATLGPWATSKIALIDYDPVWPTAYVSDASVVEGDAGTTAMAFTITLSPGASPVTVKYATADGTALAGVDYEATSGEMVFQPGDAPKTVYVPVIGDALDEGTEVFFMTITQVLTGTLTDGLGEAIVIDDDAPDGGAPGGDPCTGGAPITGARIAVKKLGGQAGDEQLTFRGRMLFAAGTPAGYTPLDAIARGAQLLVEDLGGGGAALIDLTAGAHPVAPGGYGPSPCDPAENDGWKANKKGTAYTYANGSHMLEAGGCAPGSAQGLTKFVLKDKRAQGRGIQFSVVVKGAAIAAPVGPLRGTLILDADAAAGPAGACGTHAFAAGACKANKKGTALTCK